MLISCGGGEASTSHFVPPSEESSSSASASSSSSASLPTEEAEARAKTIIDAQSSLWESYTDYKMDVTRVEDGSTKTSKYVYSSKNSFYSAVNGSEDTYLVTIDGTQTLITNVGGSVHSSTDSNVISVSSTAFELIGIIKNMALDLLEGAFNDESTVTVLDASIDEEDNFLITVDTGTFLSSYHAVADLTFASTSLLSDMTMRITEGTYANDHVSFSFTYGTTEEDRKFPAIPSA